MGTLEIPLESNLLSSFGYNIEIFYIKDKKGHKGVVVVEMAETKSLKSAQKVWLDSMVNCSFSTRVL